MSGDWNDFHDSLIKSVVMDMTARTLCVRLDSYAHADAAERVPLKIVFSDVESVTMAADLNALELNAAAGNVGYGHPADGVGTTHIYLSEGYLSVRAGRAPVIERV